MAGNNQGSISILLELIDKASPELSKFVNNYGKAVDNINKSTSSMVSNTNSSVTSMSAAFGRLAGPIAAVTAALGSLGALFEITFRYAERVDLLGDMADKYGYSASQVAILDRAVKDANGSLGEVQSMQGKVAASMSKTGDEAGKAAEAYDRLGIKTTDTKGKLRSYTEVTVDVAKKVQEGNLTTQNYADIITVAGKSALDSSVSVLAAAKAQELVNQMYADGIGITEEALKAAGDYESVTAKLSFIFDVMGSQLMQIMLPAFTELKQAFVDSYTNGGLVAQAFDLIKFAGTALANMVQILGILFVGLDLSTSTLVKTIMALGNSLEILFETPWGQKGDAFKKEWSRYWEDVVKTAEDANKRISNLLIVGTSTGTIAAPKNGKANPDAGTAPIPGNNTDTEESRYQKAVIALLKEAESYKQLTAVEQIHIQITKGGYKDFTAAHKKRLLELAAEVDATRIRDTTAKQGLIAQQNYDIAFNNMTRSGNDAKTYYENLATGGKEYADSVQAATDAMRPFNDELIQIGNAMLAARAAGETKKEQELAATYAARVKEMDARQTEIEEKAKNTSKATAETARNQAAWNTVIGQTTEAMKQLNAQEEMAWKLLGEGTLSAHDFAAEIERIDLARIDIAKGKMTEFDKTSAKMALQFQDLFQSTFYDAMQGQFDLTLDGFKKMLDQMVAEMLARKLATFLFGDVTRTGKTDSSGVATDLLGSMIQFFGFRAEGGDVTAGSPYIVGEKRAELFVPKVNGTIIPDISNLTGGGSSNSLTVQITAMDSQDVLRAMDKIKRPLVEMMNGTNRSYNLGGR